MTQRTNLCLWDLPLLSLKIRLLELDLLLGDLLRLLGIWALLLASGTHLWHLGAPLHLRPVDLNNLKEISMIFLVPLEIPTFPGLALSVRILLFAPAFVRRAHP
jgi:hypothetical protein